MGLSGIRGGLETRLQTISGLHVYKYWPAQIITPAAVVALGDGSNRYTTFSGNGMHRFDITVAVQFVDEDRAQTALDTYMDHSGTNSIIAALEGSATLSGNCEYFLVGEWNVLGVAEYGGVEYLMATLPVEVHLTY